MKFWMQGIQLGTKTRTSCHSLREFSCVDKFQIMFNPYTKSWVFPREFLGRNWGKIPRYSPVSQVNKFTGEMSKIPGRTGEKSPVIPSFWGRKKQRERYPVYPGMPGKLGIFKTKGPLEFTQIAGETGQLLQQIIIICYSPFVISYKAGKIPRKLGLSPRKQGKPSPANWVNFLSRLEKLPGYLGKFPS